MYKTCSRQFRRRENQFSRDKVRSFFILAHIISSLICECVNRRKRRDAGLRCEVPGVLLYTIYLPQQIIALIEFKTALFSTHGRLPWGRSGCQSHGLSLPLPPPPPELGGLVAGDQTGVRGAPAVCSLRFLLEDTAGSLGTECPPSAAADGVICTRLSRRTRGRHLGRGGGSLLGVSCLA